MKSNDRSEPTQISNDAVGVDINEECGDFSKHRKWYKEGTWDTRITSILDMMPPLENKKVLDLGCGIGTFTIETSKEGAFSVGIDPYYLSIVTAKKMFSEFKTKNTYLVRGDGYKLPFKTASFDVILGADVIEHINPDLLFVEIKRVIKDDGSFVSSTQNYGSLITFFGSLAKNVGLINKCFFTLNYFKDLIKLYLPIKNTDINYTKKYIGHVNPYDSIRLRRELLKRGFTVKGQKTFSWNWGYYDDFISKKIQKFLNSRFYKKHIKNSFLDLFIGHDVVIVGMKNLKAKKNET